jgi:DivIVA domain-containing protein
MALTPADVHNQQFTTVRMRTGYEMDEVDAFLDVVEAEIGRLLAENDDLRAQVTQAQSRALAAEQRAAGAKEDRAAGAKVSAAVESVDDEVVGEVVGEGTGEGAGEVVGDGVAEVVVEAAPEVATEVAVPADIAADVVADVAADVEVVDQIPASDQALKILQIAQRTADETVVHARSEAAEIMTKARSKAAEVTANLDAQRIALEKQVGQLRTFERNYRVALRDHIAGQLAEFDRAASKEESVAEPTPAIESVQAVLEESPGA